jgi:endonuclease/exonuclease/phosphatase family metal-dependent hydrolase
MYLVMKIKVMTYNLRINVVVDGVHQWPHRIKFVLQRIQKHQPDIILLQEVDKDMMNDLSSLFQEYDVYFMGRNADGGGEASPILFKKEVFSLLDKETIWLTDTPYVAGSMDEEEGYPRIASSIKLRYGKGTLRVMNCHLAFQSERAKLMNLKVLFDYAQSFSDDTPLIIAGDFNQEALHIAPYLPSQFNHALKDIQDYTFHGFQGGKGQYQIDHIYYQNKIKLIAIEVDQQEPLPFYGSDHYPVIGVFKL